jgi:hypothetical protein
MGTIVVSLSMVTIQSPVAADAERLTRGGSGADPAESDRGWFRCSDDRLRSLSVEANRPIRDCLPPGCAHGP